MRDEGILCPVDIAQLAKSNPGIGAELQHRAREARENLGPPGSSATRAIEELVKNNSYDQLEGIKNRLLEPVLRELKCANNVSPRSIGHWFKNPQMKRSSGVVDTLVAPLLEGRFKVMAGIELCNRPGHGIAQDVLELQREEERVRQAPLIPALLSGRLPQQEYHNALRPGLDAYIPVNRQLFQDFQSNFDRILRLRELARANLWRDLHEDWLPSFQALPDYSKTFQKLVGRALRHARYEKYLRWSSELAFGKSMPIAAATLSGTAASGLGLPTEIAVSTAAATAIAAELAAKAGSELLTRDLKRSTNLVTFYQKAPMV